MTTKFRLDRAAALATTGVFVVIAAVFFWLLDLGLASVTRLFTGGQGS